MNTQQNTDTTENKEKEDNKKESKEEVGGPKGPEPTRYGDWENAGKCIDF
jgi:hypothetical protein